MIARPTYWAVRGLGSAAGTAVAEILARALVRSGHPPFGSSGRSSHAQAALNAAIGDRLSESDYPLAIRMAARTGGATFPSTRRRHVNVELRPSA